MNPIIEEAPRYVAFNMGRQIRISGRPGDVIPVDDPRDWLIEFTPARTWYEPIEDEL